ncbi:GGDEF domain-containing protein [Pseudomonas oligotrophica]|uniref:GGDEF domain-containing protein n=1 Tax=Pseudomonas oligotrophica TaxID=2912055 RepID=UPI001F198DCA|nr:GGDEF domain-containing protein [Pseudomonas oligotrophica]MCF7203949.1 GGDEF domain-containing protein [Pseudomonas oligotrophica]
MKLTSRRGNFTGFIALSLLLTGFSAQLLVRSEIHRWQARFDQQVQTLSAAVGNRLDTNEAILAGFSAFLQAVEQSDEDAATRYAAAVVAAYPQVYMLEVARSVPHREESVLMQHLRHNWRPDFVLKDFTQLTGQPAEPRLAAKETWPLLFMYPLLPEASDIYGVRLETVGHLSRTLPLAVGSNEPVATPVFDLYEGGRAYILMQAVNRPPRAMPEAGPNLFGSNMLALLLMRTDALFDAVRPLEQDPHLSIVALQRGGSHVGEQLFAREPEPARPLDRLLPRLRTRVDLASQSQPTTLLFERQLRLGDVLTGDTLIILAILAGILVLLPTTLVRHLRAVERSEREHEESAYLATHDPLTGLPNRHLLADRFAEALSYWQREHTPFALMVVDLDHFKAINDRFGHEVGDQVLARIAERMLDSTRAYDTVARYGGDEFIVLMRDLAAPQDAEAAARKILEAIGRPIPTAAGVQTISCSIGVALCPIHGESFDTLLNAADQAMYRIKQQGRDNVAFGVRWH